MDATELLTQQHREAEELFSQFEQTSDTSEQSRIAETAIRQLRHHTAIEEEVLYPAMREQGGKLKEQVLEDVEEHHMVEVMLDELEGMDASDERFAAKFKVMTELVQHHVQEEEQDQFPLLSEEFGSQKLNELGDRMRERYEELESGGASGDDVDELNKEELYNRARELKIEGRSTMSRRELARAVRAAG